MSKKAVAISTVFIYVISALIVILIVYFGFRGLSGMYQSNENAMMEKLQLKMKADMSQLSMHYGSIGSFSYPVAKSYNKICFVDLTLQNAAKIDARNARLSEINPLLADNVQEAGNENVFVIGKDFLPFNAGKLTVNESESGVFCINLSGNTARFCAEGGGDSVKIITCPNE